MSDLFAKLMTEGEHQQEQVKATKATRKFTPKPTRKSAHVRDSSREEPREDVREFPTRDEIQEFSFRLRDELKVKVQAEVPHGWQEELEEIARQLKVRKLELYRFILGEFLERVWKGV